MNARIFGTDTKENYTGKFSFYIFKKGSRNPLFLQRNIRRVLDTHRKQLKASKGKKQQRMKNPGPVANGHALATPATDKIWSPREIINILERKSFSNRDPVLRIDVTAIRDRFAKYRDIRGGDDEPPKKQAKVSPVEATCSLTIWDSTSGTLDTVVEQTRKCEIFQHNKPSGERYASIELTEPFIVSLHKLLPKRERASQTYGEQLFSMQLAIMAANSTDQWPPVETKLPNPKTSQFRDPTGHLVRFPVLVAKWLRLPRVPENASESLLELFASQDHGKYKPKLSLKIDAQWLEPPSPLRVYNSEWRNCHVSSENSSRSSLAQDSGDTRNIARTEWLFEGLVGFMDKVAFDGYACALCNGQHFRDAHEFHFHLINGHDLFKFKFSQKFETNISGQSIAQGLVRVETGESYERKIIGKRIPDFREMSWHRPTHPFDLEAFLKGDESWLGKSPRRSNLAVPTPHLERSSSRETGKEIPLSAIIRPPDQVPDLVTSARKKFRVPTAPSGVRFYRTTAKCPLNEGDEVSESDDDIDEEWLLEKHTDTINSFTDTLPQEKEFMQSYDRHMLQEDISSDLHAGEALIRFCRANRTWLQSSEMRLEFSKKAAALKLQGALSSTVIRACFAIITSPTPTDPKIDGSMDIDSPLQPSRKLHYAASATPDKSNKKQPQPYRPLTPPEIGHIFGRCAKCDETILDMRKNIRCINPLCSRPDHHLRCIGLLQRGDAWICNECTSAGFLPEPKVKPVQPAGPLHSEAATATTLPVAAAITAPMSPARSASTSARNTTPSIPPNVAGDNANMLAIRSRDSSPAQNQSIGASRQLSRDMDLDLDEDSEDASKDQTEAVDTHPNFVGSNSDGPNQEGANASLAGEPSASHPPEKDADKLSPATREGANAEKSKIAKSREELGAHGATLAHEDEESVEEEEAGEEDDESSPNFQDIPDATDESDEDYVEPEIEEREEDGDVNMDESGNE